jgi:hypothetical protein
MILRGQTKMVGFTMTSKIVIRKGPSLSRDKVQKGLCAKRSVENGLSLGTMVGLKNSKRRRRFSRTLSKRQAPRRAPELPGRALGLLSSLDPGDLGADLIPVHPQVPAEFEDIRFRTCTRPASGSQSTIPAPCNGLWGSGRNFRMQKSLSLRKSHCRKRSWRDGPGSYFRAQ